MHYKITIVKQEYNESYKADGYSGYGRKEEPMFIEYTTTTATLTEEEFKKVQKAIIESME
jgi:hypothetical protein